jgi:hypothetical protein
MARRSFIAMLIGRFRRAWHRLRAARQGVRACLAALLAGGWLWQVALAAPENLAIVWDEKIEVATAEALRGPWRMNESDFRYVDDPAVAIDEQGVVGVTWVDQARKDVFFQAYGPDRRPCLEQPVNVSRSPRVFSWLPRLVMASPANVALPLRATPAGDGRPGPAQGRSGCAGEVFILWQEIVFSGGSHGGETFFARSTDGGRSFSRPLNLSNSRAGDGKGRLARDYWHNGSLDLVMGPGGKLYAAWTEFEGALWVSRSSDRGVSFSPPLQVAGPGIGAPARGPSLAVDAAGVIHLAWAVGEDRAADIHFATSADHGRTFSVPRPIVRTAGHADAPKIAVDGNRTLHLVFAESPAGPLQRYHIYYSRSNDGGRSFEPPREISGPRIALASAHFPALGVDGRGHVYVIWEMLARRLPHPRGLGFTFSGDGGQTFAPPAVIPGSIPAGEGVNGSLQGLLMRKLAVDRSGALAIVNSSFWANQGSQVWLLRGQAGRR